MYLYIENKHFILIEDVYLIIDYADFLKTKKTKQYLKNIKSLIYLKKRKER